MNTLVYGGWFGSGNLGDEAILQGVKELFIKKIPDINLTALSENPEYTQQITGINSVKIESPKTLLRDNNSYLHVFKEAEVYLLTGGTPFYDYGHISRAIHMGLPALNRKKVICFGVGTKPINSVKGRLITGTLLKNTSIISTRDSYSKQILQPLITTRIPPIRVTGDSAFILNPKATCKQSKLVLFCPRRLDEKFKALYHQEVERKQIFRIRKRQAIAADMLIEEGYRVCFLPFHCVSTDNDLEEIRIIQCLMKNDSEIIGYPKDIESAFEIIGRASLLIGMRLHSLIFAALQRVPFVAINYDIKISGFMNDFHVRRYLIEVDRESNKVFELAKQALENKKDYSLNLIKETREVRKRVELEADKIVSNFIY